MEFLREDWERKLSLSHFLVLPHRSRGEFHAEKLFYLLGLRVLYSILGVAIRSPFSRY